MNYPAKKHISFCCVFILCTSKQTDLNLPHFPFPPFYAILYANCILALSGVFFLEYFLLHQNRVISPEEMIEHIWDGSVNTFSNSIRVHISSLRKKLKAAIGFDPIQNKIGQGYILEEYR